jgi:hypothetical protein
MHHLLMASGGPGDHWLTDLLGWHLPAFGEPHDGLIRQIIQFGGQSTLEKAPWADTLGGAWPRWTGDDATALQLAALVEPLTQLRDQLRAEALAGGWEIATEPEA